MTFIVTLIALSIERFFDWENLRNWSWFIAFERAVVQRLQNKAPTLVLAAILVPLALAINILSFALSGLIYGFLTFIFNLVILLYCFGPHNLWSDTVGEASAQLNAEEIFVEGNKRIFAALIWFLILGPVGAVLYRATSLLTADLHHQAANPVLIKSAQLLEAVLDWLPIRILTFFFALGGHFTNVFTNWRKKVGSGLSGNSLLISECGAAAIGDELSIAHESAQKSAISLLDRAFVITLVFIAMFAIWL